MCVGFGACFYRCVLNAHINCNTLVNFDVKIRKKYLVVFSSIEPGIVVRFDVITLEEDIPLFYTTR